MTESKSAARRLAEEITQLVLPLMTKGELMFGLRIIALEELLEKCSPDIPHTHAGGIRLDCRKCQIEAVLKSRKGAK